MAQDPEDFLDYQALIQQALRGVVREALTRVARHGLPGDHHFYLSFKTSTPGVVVPAVLRDRYPDEMTVVLQRQFWDLLVDDDGISVTLAFESRRERIGLPWEALTAFVDPAAEFALRLDTDEPRGGEPEDEAPDDEEQGADEGSDDASADVVSIRRFRKKDDD